MYIGHTVVSAVSVIRNLVSDCRLLAAHSLVQAAPQRIRRITGDSIVHPHTCKINILRFARISSVLETDVAESEAYDLVVRVIRAEKDGRSVIIARIVHIEFREIRIIDIIDHLLRDERNEDKVLHIALDGHIHI